MKPNFLIVGASRSGTTFLHACLMQHPDIFLAEPKELRFFDKDVNYTKGFSHYASSFSFSDEYIVRGEASPPYFHQGITFDENENYRFDPNHDSAKRIKSHIPDCKILITLRNPIYRLYSQFWKNRYYGIETYTLHDALNSELEGKRTKETSPCCWLYKNHYSIHLNHWFQLFGRPNVKVLIFEDWTKNIRHMLDDVCNFLGVNMVDIDNDQFQIGNKNTGLFKRQNKIQQLVKRLFGRKIVNERYPAMSVKERKMISNLLEKDIVKVQALLGKEIIPWIV